MQNDELPKDGKKPLKDDAASQKKKRLGGGPSAEFGETERRCVREKSSGQSALTSQKLAA